jgi:DNA polymerase III alpha subunit
MKRCGIKSVKSLGKQAVYNITMLSNPHNYLLYDNNKNKAVISLNSHAVAYSYLSSRLLYLKTHYPLEFFTAILSCESDEDKVKEYKTEAQRFGINVNRIDLNKSKERFSIYNNSIYIGFANIKGIGDEPAARIVAQQPYNGFEDFLSRFGTDAKVIKPLLALRCFNEASPVTLFEFAEYFKTQNKKREDRDKRNIAARDKIVDELLYLVVQAKALENPCEDQIAEWRRQSAAHLEQSLQWSEEESIDNLNIWLEDCLDRFDKKVWQKILGKYKKNINTIKNKQTEDKPISLKSFEPTGKIDEKLAALLRSPVERAEEEFYGFGWIHPLELCPECEGRTFSEFKKKIEVEDTAVYLMEVRVVERPKQMKSKTDKIYYTFKVEDSEWQTEGVTIWEEDYKRFEKELNFWESDAAKGNLLKIRLGRPKPPFKNYTFDSPPKAVRHLKVPKEKEDDMRMKVIPRSEVKGNHE